MVMIRGQESYMYFLKQKRTTDMIRESQRVEMEERQKFARFKILKKFRNLTEIIPSCDPPTDEQEEITLLNMQIEMYHERVNMDQVASDLLYRAYLWHLDRPVSCPLCTPNVEYPSTRICDNCNELMKSMYNF